MCYAWRTCFSTNNRHSCGYRPCSSLWCSWCSIFSLLSFVLHIIACPFLLFLFVIALSVLRSTASDYPFGIFISGLKHGPMNILVSDWWRVKTVAAIGILVSERVFRLKQNSIWITRSVILAEVSLSVLYITIKFV